MRFERRPKAGLRNQEIIPLDGFLNDANGRYDWAEPDEEVFSFTIERERPIRTCLMGRRMYEEMIPWETLGAEPGQTRSIVDFADALLAKDKVVSSRTLDAFSTGRTRIERSFDPDAVWRMVRASVHDLSIAGATLAAPAVRAGLVNEFQLYLVPAVVGGGTQFLPDDARFDLDLVEAHRFRSGIVVLRYAPCRP